MFEYSIFWGMNHISDFFCLADCPRPIVVIEYSSQFRFAKKNLERTLVIGVRLGQEVPRTCVGAFRAGLSRMG